MILQTVDEKRLLLFAVSFFIWDSIENNNSRQMFFQNNRPELFISDQLPYSSAYSVRENTLSRLLSELKCDGRSEERKFKRRHKIQSETKMRN